MGMDMVIDLGLGIGILLIGAGYLTRTNAELSFLAGFRESWEPINKVRLANRIEMLFIMIGVLAILTAIFTLSFGAIVGNVSGVLAIVVVIMIVIILDQIGL